MKQKTNSCCHIWTILALKWLAGILIDWQTQNILYFADCKTKGISKTIGLHRNLFMFGNLPKLRTMNKTSAFTDFTLPKTHFLFLFNVLYSLCHLYTLFHSVLFVYLCMKIKPNHSLLNVMKYLVWMQYSDPNLLQPTSVSKFFFINVSTCLGL